MCHDQLARPGRPVDRGSPVDLPGNMLAVRSNEEAFIKLAMDRGHLSKQKYTLESSNNALSLTGKFMADASAGAKYTTTERRPKGYEYWDG